MEREKKQTMKIYEKWWFWVCIVIIVLIISFAVALIEGYKYATSGLNAITLEIHNKINKDINVYTSTGNSMLILEFPTFMIDDSNTESRGYELKEAIEILLSHSDVLSTYKDIICYASFIEDGEEDICITKAKYNYEKNAIEEEIVKWYSHTNTF